MKELDLLKKDWQKSETSFTPIQEAELYKMLHTKSSSIVKRIFMISILEMLLWTVVSVFFNSDEYLKNISFENFNLIFELINYLNYGIILIFIYLFYKNYKAISTTVSTKQLMIDILKTRKTVQYYVGYNLIMVVLSIVLGFYFGLTNNVETLDLKKNTVLTDTNFIVLTGVFVLTISIALGLFWLFYKLLYGILVRKLHSNYKELEKIEI